MASAASTVSGVGLGQAVLYAGCWRQATKEQFEAPWSENTVPKQEIGIKDAYDLELHKFAFTQEIRAQILILIWKFSPQRTRLKSTNFLNRIPFLFFLYSYLDHSPVSGQDSE